MATGGKEPGDKQRWVLRMRGLPWECSEQDIRAFFTGLSIIQLKIVMLPNGRSSGEGVVEFQSESALKLALARNNEEIDRRYIELFTNTGEDMDQALGIKVEKKRGPFRRDSFVIRVRGMPFATQKPAVVKFFARKGLSPLAIHFVKDQIGRPSGICYAEFATRQEQKRGLSLNREYIGSRYVEIFQSSIQELERDVQEGLPLGVITGGLGAPSRDGTQIDKKKKKESEEEAQQNIALGLMPPPITAGILPAPLGYLPNPWGVILPTSQALPLGYPMAQVPSYPAAYPLPQPQMWQSLPQYPTPPLTVFQTPIKTKDSKPAINTENASPSVQLPQPTNQPQQVNPSINPPQPVLPPPAQTFNQRSNQLYQTPIVYSQPLNSVNMPQTAYQVPSGNPLDRSTGIRYYPY